MSKGERKDNKIGQWGGGGGSEEEEKEGHEETRKEIGYQDNE